MKKTYLVFILVPTILFCILTSGCTQEAVGAETAPQNTVSDSLENSTEPVEVEAPSSIDYYPVAYVDATLIPIFEEYDDLYVLRASSFQDEAGNFVFGHLIWCMPYDAVIEYLGILGIEFTDQASFARRDDSFGLMIGNEIYAGHTFISFNSGEFGSKTPLTSISISIFNDNREQICEQLLKEFTDLYGETEFNEVSSDWTWTAEVDGRVTKLYLILDQDREDKLGLLVGDITGVSS